MKINKAKLLVGTLAVAAVAATVGSISGTVAWFQYSTRSTVAYSGAAAHVSENLQIRLYKAAQGEQGQPNYVAPISTEWKSDLRVADVQDYIKAVRGDGADYDLRPITSGAALDATNKVATEFYKDPNYQKSGVYETTKNHWLAATEKDYVELPIELRVIDRDGAAADSETFLNKPIYLTDLTVKDGNAANSGKGNISDALRVSFECGDNKVTFSNKGDTVATSGYLDLNGDGRLDKKEGYEDFQQLDNFMYGGKLDNDQQVASEEVTTKIRAAETTATADDYLADDSDDVNIVGKALGTTNGASGLKVTVRIYLEGWQQLSTEVKSVATAYDDLAAMEAADGDLFEEGAYYKTKDNKVYKCTSITKDGDNPAVAAFGDALTDGKDTVSVWNDKEFVSAKFNVGMRFSTTRHADTDH